MPRDIFVKGFKRLDIEDAFRLGSSGDSYIFPKGIYDIDGLTTKDGSVRYPAECNLISEVRHGAIIRRADNSIAHAIFANQNFDKAGSADREITIDGFTFDNNYDNQTIYNPNGSFVEHSHCLYLLGTQETKVMNNRFINLVGDGALVGATWDGPTRLTIPFHTSFADNYFNGQLRNRNGITFTSGIWCAVEGSNTFEKCARPDMPAAVDIEPDVPEDWCEQIHVSGTFKNNKADVYFMALVAGTTIRGCGSNIKTNHPVPWESVIARGLNAKEIDVFQASTKWDA